MGWTRDLYDECVELVPKYSLDRVRLGEGHTLPGVRVLAAVRQDFWGKREMEDRDGCDGDGEPTGTHTTTGWGGM